MIVVLDLQAYLNRLASAEPTPGGGSAASLVGAFGAALIAMVARITLGNPAFAAVHGEAVMLIEVADGLRAKFTAARPDDEKAYRAVVDAQALPRGSDGEKRTRTARLQAALFDAAEAPLHVAMLSQALFAACVQAAGLHNTNLMSDVACALAFARAALDAAAANVRINHRYMKDADRIAEQAERLRAILGAAREAEELAAGIIAGR